MRTMTLLIALCLLSTLPASASAADAIELRPLPSTGTHIDPDVEVSPDGCEDCYEVSLRVVQVIPQCCDFPGVLVDVGVEGEGTDPRVHVLVCQLGYASYCVPDDLRFVDLIAL